MSARCSLVVNGRSVRVSTGETPLEAALAEGMIAPAQGVHGAGLGQGPGSAGRRAPSRGRRPEAVKLSSPRAAQIEAREAARTGPAARRTGDVARTSLLCPRASEVVVTLTRRLALDPGHQVVVTFGDLPPLTLAPTLRLEATTELDELVFHVLHESAGGADFGPGALPPGLPVTVRGPVGRGQYRPGGGRLVLVAGETGFAPIWAIARAARYVEPAREMVLVVGARDPLDLYMRPALDWLRATGVGRIAMIADRSRQRPPDVRPGPLTAHVPSLRATDAVHVAGDAVTVGAVEVLAAAAGARCYPIPLPDGA